MAIKELTTRIALKYDTFENWSKTEVADQGANLVLLRGEIGICEVPSVNAASNVAPTVLFKVGDGTKKFSELPWASAKAADVYQWAKASDVVVDNDNKTIKFVGGAIDSDGNKTDKVITLNFATPEEVETVRSGLDSRIVALENKFTGTGSVQGQIDAIDGRLDVIEGEGEGSVKKALADAKSYADGLAGNYDAEGSAAQALVDAKAYADGKDAAIAEAKKAGTDAASALSAYQAEMVNTLAGKQDVIAANTYDAYGAAADVKTYVDETVVPAANTYADGKASAAETAAKGYADGIVATEKSAREAEDLRLAGLIGDNADAIAAETEAREGAINTINGKLDVEKVSTAIATAKQEAIDSAATTAQGKVDALANGQVKTNKEAIATLSGTVTSEIARVEGLVTAEKNRAEGIEGGLRTDVDNIKAFFETAEGETLDTALDTLKEIQDYLNGEGEATGGMIDRVAAAETAISNLNKEFAEGGRVTVAENAIDAVEADIAEYKNTVASALEGKQDVIPANTYDAYGSASKALDDAKGYADGLASNYEVAGAAAKALTDAKAYTDGEVDKLEAKDAELQGNIDNKLDKSDFTTHTTGHAKSATEITAEIEAAVKVEEDARKAADKAITDTIGTVESGKTVVGMIGEVSTVAGRADAKSIDNGNILATLTGDNGRVTVAEGKITALENTVGDSNSGLVKSVADLVALTGDNGAIRQEIAAAKKAGDDAAAAVTALTNGQVATNKTNIEGLDSRLTAVENDYVKASDLVGDYYIFNCGSSTTVTHVVPKN